MELILKWLQSDATATFQFSTRPDAPSAVLLGNVSSFIIPFTSQLTTIRRIVTEALCSTPELRFLKKISLNELLPPNEEL
jgi:hypothetical protein